MLLFFKSKMGISLLTYGLDDTVLPSDRLNANFRNYMDNFTDIDDGLYVEDDELLSIVFNIISKDVVLRSIIFNMVDGKKAKVARFVYPRKTREELWNTVWGKRITGCRDDILLLVVVFIPILECRRSLGRIFAFPLLCLKRLS